MNPPNNLYSAEFPMQKYGLNGKFVEAIEVTARYVSSLPNAGAALQRFGEQVEILHHGPVPKKTYAQVGEFIVCFKDMNNRDTYVVVSNAAFKGLFRELDPSEISNANAVDAQAQKDIQDSRSNDTSAFPTPSHPFTPTTGHDAEAYDDLHRGESQSPPVESNETTSQPSKESVWTMEKNKEEKRQQRLKELKESDMSIEEKQLEPEGKN